MMITAAETQSLTAEATAEEAVRARSRAAPTPRGGSLVPERQWRNACGPAMVPAPRRSRLALWH